MERGEYGSTMPALRDVPIVGRYQYAIITPPFLGSPVAYRD